MGRLLAAAVLLGFALGSRRGHRSRAAAGAVALAAMLVAGPVSELGYALFLLPVLLHRKWTLALGEASGRAAVSPRRGAPQDAAMLPDGPPGR